MGTVYLCIKLINSHITMKIAKDKLQHFVVCAIVAVIIATIVACTDAPPLPSCVAGFLGATACGLGKEYGDSKSYGNTWSWTDIVSDMTGAAIGCLAGLVSLLI